MRARPPTSVSGTVALSAAALLVIASIDFLTGTELSFSLFYLGPIGLLAWRTGLTGGILASLVGAAVWYSVDAAGQHVYAHPLIALWNSVVRLGFFVIVTVLLVKMRESMDRERSLARTDPLTGLLNRRSFTDMAAREIKRSGRTGQPVSFAYIDLDGFKGINDRLGHAAGDEILGTVARVLDLVLRSIDLKARLGGDEFAVAMPDTTVDAAGIALQRLSAGLVVAGVACSIGAVVFETPPADVAAALAAVDAVMYRAKGDPERRIAVSVATPLASALVTDRPVSTTPPIGATT